MFLKQSTVFRRWFYLPSFGGTMDIMTGVIILRSSGDGGETVAFTIAKEGASSFSNPSAGAAILTDAGSGWYYYDLSVDDTDTLGALKYALQWAAFNYGEQDQIAELIPGGAATSVIGDVGGKVLGGGISSYAGDGVFALTAPYVANGDVVSSATSTSITPSTISGADGKYVGQTLAITTGEGQYQCRTITSFISNVFNLDRELVTIPGEGDAFVILYSDGPSKNANLQVIASSVTGNVDGNVTGSVANVLGSVDSVTGDVGGNVVGSVDSVFGDIGGSVQGDVVGSVSGDIAGNVLGNVIGSVNNVTIPVQIDLNQAVDTGTVGTALYRAMNSRIAKNASLYNYPFYMVLASDHITPATGKTVSATVSIDGAAFITCVNSPTEIENGLYKINLEAPDLNGDTIVLLFGAAACDNRVVAIVTQP